jgi:thiopeptide-type bacteriocin biosynthesis protein
MLDSYDREIERYGGLEGMQVAEQIFAADSDAIIDIIALRIDKIVDLSPVDLALLTVDSMLSGLGVRSDERVQLYQAVCQGQQTAFGKQMDRLQKKFHHDRRTVQRIVGDREWLHTQLGGYALETCLYEQATMLRPLGKQLQMLIEQGKLWTSKLDFLSSCVHMHCNRLLGVDRALEFEVMYYLKRTLESLERYMPYGIQLE